MSECTTTMKFVPVYLSPGAAAAVYIILQVTSQVRTNLKIARRPIEEMTSSNDR